MIDKRELRIGNKVRSPKHNLEIATVQGIATNDIVMLEEVSTYDFFSEIEPIPVTSEWIERFGGKRLRGVPFYEIDMNRNIGQIHINPENGMIFLRHHRNPQTSLNPMSDNTYCVHQIQNLYFALTGEELTIKETV